MSRSYRKNHIGNTESGACHAWKKQASRTLRKVIKAKLKENAEILPLFREVTNSYDRPSDKVYFQNFDWKEKLKRK